MTPTFIISFGNKDKLTGTRKFRYFGERSYEEILFDILLDKICNTMYNVNYDFAFLGDIIIIKRIKANVYVGSYSVECMDIEEKDKVVANYFVEIEHCSSLELNFLVEEFRIQYQEERNNLVHGSEPKKKEKKLSKWIMKESKGIRDLLSYMAENNIDIYKEIYSKATYYRNKKLCEEKGYIKNGKLVRKVFV